MFGIFETRYSATTVHVHPDFSSEEEEEEEEGDEGEKESDGVARLINNRDSRQIVFCANNTNRIVHENSEFFQDVYFVPFYRLIFFLPCVLCPAAFVLWECVY